MYQQHAFYSPELLVLLLLLVLVFDQCRWGCCRCCSPACCRV
jgi:hypothetical protein